MPIYEFKCKECGHEFELIMRASANKDEVTCPKCHAKNTERLMSAFSAGTSSSGGFSASSSCGGGAFT